MKFDTPATTIPIDQLKVVGRATDRIDGPFKTTGTAPYAYERHDVAPNQAYGYVVGSAIAKGRVDVIDTAAAKSAPGVIAIVTTLETPRLAKGAMNIAFLFGGADIQHYHQAIAVVVAETFEQARAACARPRAVYEVVREVRSRGRCRTSAARRRRQRRGERVARGASGRGLRERL
jgi:xanthine dehydrogenase YagR molybdenum-binding subunit